MGPSGGLLTQGAAGVPAEQVRRSASIRRWLRLILVGSFVAAVITEPPARNVLWCWVLVGGYLLWTLGVDVLRRSFGERAERLVWVGLFVDMAVLAALTLLTASTADVSWTPYLLLTGFFVVPVMAAAQLNPLVCAVVTVPAVAVYLGAGLAIRHLDDEPISYVLLRTLLLAAVCFGALLLTSLQRSRVQTITALLAERNILLGELVSLQQREQRELAESLHDGALQYVLAARQELDDAIDGDQEAMNRIDQALGEASRLLRSTMSQLHPAVLDAAGLGAALADLVETIRARGRLVVALDVQGWDDQTRTPADDLLLGTARELLTNVAKHARARQVQVELSQVDGLADLVIADDGVGMSEVDVDTRLRAGHLGLASRRIRVAAAGGTIDFRPVQPHGTLVHVRVPLTAVAAGG
jgi:two-component system NarL family sensor kinase